MAVTEGLPQSGLCSLASPPCAQPPARPPCPELCDQAQPKAQGSGLLPTVSWQSQGKMPVQLSRTVRMLTGSSRGSPPAVSHTGVAWGRGGLG